MGKRWNAPVRLASAASAPRRRGRSFNAAALLPTSESSSAREPSTYGLSVCSGAAAAESAAGAAAAATLVSPFAAEARHRTASCGVVCRMLMALGAAPSRKRRPSRRPCAAAAARATAGSGMPTLEYRRPKAKVRRRCQDATMFSRRPGRGKRFSQQDVFRSSARMRSNLYTCHADPVGVGRPLGLPLGARSA